MFRPLGGIYRVEVCNEPQLAAPLAVALAAAPVAQLFPEYISGAHQLNFVIDAAVQSVQSRCSRGKVAMTQWLVNFAWVTALTHRCVTGIACLLVTLAFSSPFPLLQPYAQLNRQV